MFDNQYIIYAVIVVGVFTAYMAVVNIFRSDRMKTRVKTATDGLYQEIEEEESTPPFALFCESILKVIGINVRAQKDLTMMLAQAGITNPHGVTYYLFFKRIVQPILLLLGLALFMKAILFSVGTGLSTKLFRLLVAVMLLGAGVYGANMYVSNRKQHRQHQLLKSFPEVLDLLLVCIESGLGLDAALMRTCREMQNTHPDIAGELERTRMELTMLSDRVQALQNLADRTEIVPFKSLVSALIQTEKFGTSLVDTLRVLSEDQRVARLLNAENKAARIPVLITIPLIVCILPAFIMIILGPPIIRVVQNGGIFGSASANR